MKKTLWMAALATLIATAGCKRDRSDEPITAPVAGEASDDTVMHERIRTELRSDPMFSRSADTFTFVTEDDGMIVLRGSVSSEQERLAAERAAARIAGEGKIRNELVILAAPAGTQTGTGTYQTPGTAPGTAAGNDPSGTAPPAGTGTMGTQPGTATGTGTGTGTMGTQPSGTGTMDDPTRSQNRSGSTGADTRRDLGTGTGTDTDQQVPPNEPPTNPPRNPSAPTPAPNTGGAGGY
jgi:hypothetical protein